MRKRYTVSDGKLVLRLEAAEEGGYIVTSPLDPELITEAESIVVRDVNEKVLGNMKNPPPTFTEALAPSERVARSQMLRMPDIYFEALDKLSDETIPWDKDAYRFENGMVTCGSMEACCTFGTA